jgi:voltage-gated potassium channel
MAALSLPTASRRERIRDIIFLADTPAGKAFDITVIVIIALSVLTVMLDSSEPARVGLAGLLEVAEWVFTALFVLEYALRIFYARKRRQYLLSFFGIIDLLAILPALIALAFPSALYLGVLRVIRILRVFRVLKLAAYLVEANVILRALRASRRKITVFLFAVFIIAIVLGSLMYVIEGDQSGFTSIPRGVYWAIVTLTTVGYGDLAPQTAAGQALATLVMIMGYGMIAVPTGLVTAHVVQASRESASEERDGRSCPGCGKDGHHHRAAFCDHCGTALSPNASSSEIG